MKYKRLGQGVIMATDIYEKLADHLGPMMKGMAAT